MFSKLSELSADLTLFCLFLPFSLSTDGVQRVSEVRPDSAIQVRPLWPTLPDAGQFYPVVRHDQITDGRIQTA